MQVLHYQLGKKVGEGDMGSVYLATDTRNQQAVAVKILHKIDMKAKMDRGAAAEVLEFAASISHPALQPILSVIDTDEHGGILGIVMPQAAASVGDFLESGKKIPLKNAMTIFETIANVLTNLHQNEIAHGSVKPTNILLDRNGNALLTDLAMAHLRDMGMIPANPTRLQQFYTHIDLMYHSTPEYAADLFSFVTFVYHVLSGRLPYSDPRPEIRTVEQPIRADLDARVFATLARGMTHRKQLVYPDVAAFMEDFKRALSGQKIDETTARWFMVKDEEPEEE